MKAIAKWTAVMAAGVSATCIAGQGVHGNSGPSLPREIGKGPAAVTVVRGGTVTDPPTVEAAAGKVVVLQAKIADAENELSSTRSKVAAGLLTMQEIPPLETKLLELRVQLEEARAELVKARRYAALGRKVTFTLTNVGVREAARVLSEASSESISVDAAVPVDVVVSAQATDVPLGTALEFIANSADLNIDAAPDGGLKLERPAVIQTGSRRVVVRTASWPWTGDLGSALLEGGPSVPLGARWRILASKVPGSAESQPSGAENKVVLTLESNGVPGEKKPTSFDAKSVSARMVTRDGKPVEVITGTEPWMLEAQSMRIVVTDDGKAVFDVVTERAPRPKSTATRRTVQPVRQVAGGAARRVVPSEDGICVTSIGANMIVVSEPGSGPKGVPGVWLTVYKVKSGKLVEVGSTFYRSHERAGRDDAIRTKVILIKPNEEVKLQLRQRERAAKGPSK